MIATIKTLNKSQTNDKQVQIKDYKKKPMKMISIGDMKMKCRRYAAMQGKSSQEEYYQKVINIKIILRVKMKM